MEGNLMPRFERRVGFRGGGRGGGSWGRGEDRGGGYGVPKPVKLGEEYDVEISEVGSKGDGIARVKNFVVFVSGVKQGEKCKIKIKEVRNRFAIGEKVGVESTEAGESVAGESEAGAEVEEAEAKEAEAEPEVEAEEVAEGEVAEAEESEEEA